MKNISFAVILFFLLGACNLDSQEESLKKQSSTRSDVQLIVLGIAQDAGAPQAGCLKSCCSSRHLNSALEHRVVSLGIVDKSADHTYLIEATPNIVSQIHDLSLYNTKESHIPSGIFLTHAHMGHYSGLIHLGKEAMNTKNVPVFAMPRMTEFLKNNGPWSQLHTSGNIKLNALSDSTEVELSSSLRIMPFTVPHRDEFSETVGYKISGPNKSAIFIPDIDKWTKWNQNIIEIIKEVDYAFLDATFYDAEEINHRDISEIPHPFIIESLEQFKDLEASERAKIHFIHLNHTNPALEVNSAATAKIKEMGFNLARDLQAFNL